jgi:hypothetical protein
MRERVRVDGPNGPANAILTDEHNATSEGYPVLLIGDGVYRPGDLPDGTVVIGIDDPELADAAYLAGFAVEDD